MKKKQLSELEKEKLLDQEEIINFYYIDKESNTKILVHDKRKIKVALLQMQDYERKQRNEIMENECPYNSKTDDPIVENSFDEPSEFEQDLEDALQEMADQISKKSEERKKILKFFSDNIFEFTEKQLILIFLRYYLDLSSSKIMEFLHITKQTYAKHIDRIDKKLKKLA